MALSSLTVSIFFDSPSQPCYADSRQSMEDAMTTFAQLKDDGFSFLKSARMIVPALLATVGSVVSSCGDKGSDPTPGGEPVTPPRKVALRVNADGGSVITFYTVRNKDIPQNDVDGFGYIYDVRFSQLPFKASTSEQPEGQVGSTLNEKFAMKVNEDNIKENGEKSQLQPVNANEFLFELTPIDGSFYKDNTMDVVRLVVFANESGIPAKNLNYNTVKEAVLNAKYNFETGKYPRTINITEPSALKPVQ